MGRGERGEREGKRQTRRQKRDRDDRQSPWGEEGPKKAEDSGDSEVDRETARACAQQVRAQLSCLLHVSQPLGTEHIYPVFFWKTRLMAFLSSSTKAGKILPRPAQPGEDVCPSSHSKAVTPPGTSQDRTLGPVLNAILRVPLWGSP